MNPFKGPITRARAKELNDQANVLKDSFMSFMENLMGDGLRFKFESKDEDHEGIKMFLLTMAQVKN